MAKRTEKSELPSGIMLEQAVWSHLYGHDPYFKKLELKDSNEKARLTGNLALRMKMKEALVQNQEREERRSRSIGWWQPPKKSLFFEYLENSSMHGLKYIAQPKRHLSERVFWAIAFLLSAAAAAYFINNIWTRYYESPVIFAFRPVETDIHSIPFPAVTLCNVDRISLDVINQLTVRAAKSANDPFAITAKQELEYVNIICNWMQSFSKIHGFADSRGKLNITRRAFVKVRKPKKIVPGLGLTRFLFAKTNPCDEMVLLCTWGSRRRKCSKLFKPTMTSLGKCCTFNALPSYLLYSRAVLEKYRVQSDNSTTKSGPTPWPPKELAPWKRWNYGRGFILNRTEKRPYRQRRPGSVYGLSILLNSRTSRYFCPSTDSEGFRMHLHSQIDIPEIEKFGSVIGLGNEIFMEIEPQMTMADPKIRRVNYHKRGCVYPDEIQLDYYSPYSTSNCVLECTSKTIQRNCSCVPFTLPRFTNVSVCSSDVSSDENKCAVNVSRIVADDLKLHCNNCIPLCSSLAYKFKITRASLQNASKVWMDYGPNLRRAPDWASDKLTLLHIFYSRLSFVPRERRELYGITDLIANTGNLLTLCLGFSILSGVEIVYFLTVRVIMGRSWGKHSERQAGAEEEATKGSPQVVQADANKKTTAARIYSLKPRFIPVQGAPSNGNNNSSMIQNTKKKFPLFEPRTNDGGCLFFIENDLGIPGYGRAGYNTQKQQNPIILTRQRKH